MSKGQARKTRILVLEDIPRDADAIKDNLESYGWDALIASDLNQFNEQITNNFFDIYIIDYDIPSARGSNQSGGGEKALDILRNTIGIVPVIIYSAVLESELQEKDVIERGASYILRKGKSGSALAALIKRIIGEHDEKIGLGLKSYFTSRLGERTFYLRLISEKRNLVNGEPRLKIVAEVQRLFDDTSETYEVELDKDGVVINSRQKTS